jgi:hypothetical protein
MPLLPSRFDFLDYLYANPQIQQDFTPRTAQTEAKRGTVIYDFLATQNGLATSRTRGLNVTNISKGVRRHQEPGGLLQCREQDDWPCFSDIATKEAVHMPWTSCMKGPDKLDVL